MEMVIYRKFSVHSLYEWLEFGGTTNTEYTIIWLTNMSLKIKIFVWLVKRDIILTKLNLIKKGWVSNTKCVFYDDEESTSHLFITCPLANQIWQWIIKYNNFIFEGTTLLDLWHMNCCIISL
jgi:zinc-binding in reverse transcriptase